MKKGPGLRCIFIADVLVEILCAIVYYYVSVNLSINS